MLKIPFWIPHPMQPANLNQPLKASLQSIPDGADGINATLQIMKALVKDFRKDLTIRTLAVQIVNKYGQKDYLSEIKALQAFVRDKIRYVKDVRDVETIQTPFVTIQMRSGDCDDKCTLLASMLEAIGHPTRFVAIGFQHNTYEHVLVETRLNRSWIPLECTEPVDIGWYPKNVVSRMVLHI
jgi:transglutaminase-like putative cysteine protease